MNNVIIFGATSFVGSHLIDSLIERDDVCLTIVARLINLNELEDKYKGKSRLNLVFHKDLAYEELNTLLHNKNTIINLVYIDNSIDANINFIKNLKLAAINNNVNRLIHFSTADIVGRNSTLDVNESILPKPIGLYAISKFNIENQLLRFNHDDALDVVVLRPTAIFGPGGKNLNKTILDLYCGNQFINFLKSFIYGNRNVNLVSVFRVVDACIFLMDFRARLHREVFFISDDDSHLNNFADVASTIRNILSVTPSKLLPIKCPIFILKLVLLIMNKNNINPLCTYSTSKLYSFGFKSNQNFESNLSQYIIYFKTKFL